MPKISQTGLHVPASPIRKLVPYAEAAKRRGVHVYHLNIGQPDIPTPDEALAAIREVDVRTIAYTHSAGIGSYREALARFYTDRGLPLTAEQLIVTTGGSEAILMAMLATCDWGNQVIVPEPYYANYNGFAMEAGIEIVPVRSYIEDDFALPPIEEFEKRITPKTRAILICNPNNPTGYLYSEEEILKLREIALRHDLFLLADEVYSDFCYNGARHHSVLALQGVDEHVVMMDSISKRFSMCGARIGVLASRNPAVIDAVLRMGQARLCAPYVGQVAAEAALRASKSYFTTVHNEYEARRNFMIGALNRMEGVRCPMPRGAFYAIAELPVDDADRFAQWLLEEFELDGRTVMVAPASGFYSDPAAGRRQVRLAYVLNIDDLRGAMEVLEQALKVYPGRC
ncbi:pyridoxal phosphate-dependent aminotransferase [uncultured Rikenella sp.]|mgnify:FL=1|uniref:pyridoxal phosphate-dependent aminotransferase n=1 Tax=uncultured Rikenella sp. TaxID=368003 RepID=UPI0025EC9F1F|nr:pyridoxal phosphate-dependent aminotransferase [uncultured Rikenella sp.]